MRFHAFLTASMLTLTFATSHAFAETDKQKKQAEIRQAAATALQEFYKAQPEPPSRRREIPRLCASSPLTV